MDKGILPPPHTPWQREGKENTVGWRRAQLSALINHTGQLTPPPLLLSDPLRAPHAGMCRSHTWHVARERIFAFPDFQFKFQKQRSDFL